MVIKRPACVPTDGSSEQPNFCVLMVTDFFYPNCGGVENHVYYLSQCLMALGHKVVVVTHAYGACAGVRHLTHGLKVYYLYRRPFYQQSTFPTFGFGPLRMLRLLCKRERVSLVHAHQAFSALALEACLAARTMGYRVVFTDHSLFGFADAASIVMNKLLKCVLADIQHVVCVSHTSKENTVLRACLPPARVSVIPNGAVSPDAAARPRCIKTVDARGGGFKPDPGTRPPNATAGERVVVVALSRLVYRKGIDLFALVIPYICALYPNVDFLIGGGGPKAKLLAAMIEDHDLGGRVTLAGPIPHEQAAAFMRRGSVFLNGSLTEAFCMAVVEAAACGLLVVSTAVGGIPEVLPPDMLELADPSAEGLCRALERALSRLHHVDPHAQHERVAGMYCWQDVAQRTAHVYAHVMCGTPLPVPAVTQHHAVTEPALAVTGEAAVTAAALAASDGAGWTVKERTQGAPKGGKPRPQGQQATNTSSTGAKQPAAGIKQAAGTKQPAAGIKQPAAGAKQPAASTKQPATGTKQAAGTKPAGGPRAWVPGGVCVHRAQQELVPRLGRTLVCGRVAGPLFCALLTALHLWWVVLECWLQPAAGIEVAWDWPVQ